MKILKMVLYYAVGSIIIYLALIFLRYLALFILRYWILLLVLMAVTFIVYLRIKPNSKPWWIAKTKDCVMGFNRKGGNKSAE